MSALPKPFEAVPVVGPWWPDPQSKLQAHASLQLEPSPGCGRLDRSDFASWTPEGRATLARLLRAVIERNDTRRTP